MMDATAAARDTKDKAARLAAEIKRFAGYEARARAKGQRILAEGWAKSRMQSEQELADLQRQVVETSR